MNDLSSLEQRVGNRYWGGSDAMARAGVTPAASADTSTPSAFWGRIEGKHTSLQPSNTTGSTYDADQIKSRPALTVLCWGTDGAS